MVAGLTFCVAFLPPPVADDGWVWFTAFRFTLISVGLKSKYTSPTLGNVIQRSDAGTRAPASAATPIAAPAARFAPAATIATVIAQPLRSQETFVDKHKPLQRDAERAGVEVGPLPAVRVHVAEHPPRDLLGLRVEEDDLRGATAAGLPRVHPVRGALPQPGEHPRGVVLVHGPLQRDLRILDLTRQDGLVVVVPAVHLALRVERHLEALAPRPAA